MSPLRGEDRASRVVPVSRQMEDRSPTVGTSEGRSPSRGARPIGDPPEDEAGGNGSQAVQRGHGAPDASRLTQPRKTIIGVLVTLTLLLIGFRNHMWLKETEFPQRFRRFYAVIAEYGSRLSHYQARLQMPREQMEALRNEIQASEDKLQKLRFLTQQVEGLMALLRDGHRGNAEEAPSEQQGTPEMDEETSLLVEHILRKLREDQVQRVDYALQSAGASIIEAGTSESYRNDKAKLHWRGIGFLNHEMPPDVILQPDVHPGKCWAFPGSQGHALIKLARKIIPMAVTVEHISERVSPSGNITSAPQEFSVYGVPRQCEGEEVFLGRFLYNRTGATVQTFKLQHELSESLLCVKLKILSNWGHLKYTCLYRFRVHGTPGSHS